MKRLDASILIGIIILVLPGGILLGLLIAGMKYIHDRKNK